MGLEWTKAAPTVERLIEAVRRTREKAFVYSPYGIECRACGACQSVSYVGVWDVTHFNGCAFTLLDEYDKAMIPPPTEPTR